MVVHGCSYNSYHPVIDLDNWMWGTIIVVEGTPNLNSILIPFLGLHPTSAAPH